MSAPTAAIVTAHNEQDRIAETLTALALTFPEAELVVADDYSSDQTVTLARRNHARVVTNSDAKGKGGAATVAAGSLGWASSEPGAVVLFCDGDLGRSAALLRPLVEAVAEQRAEMAVAVFSRKLGGGFGIAVGFARWALRSLTGRHFRAPISGQRVLSVKALEKVTPFSSGFGMELGMTADACLAGLKVEEIEIDLEHRVSGRNLAGFRHRGRQLRDFVAVYLSKRRAKRYPNKP